MTNLDPIPQSYEQWRVFITVRCRLALTETYIASRLAELNDLSHPKTREFSGKYGQQYLTQVIQWFEAAQKEL